MMEEDSLKCPECGRKNCYTLKDKPLRRCRVCGSMWNYQQVEQTHTHTSQLTQ